jgi:hypothetical protein
MNPIRKYVTLILFLVASMGESIASDITPILSAAATNAVLVVKADKEMVGGKVMVFNSNKDLVTASKMKKRKLEIDFSNADFGVYTVRIVKGNELKEFHFLKK